MVQRVLLCVLSLSTAAVAEILLHRRPAPARKFRVCIFPAFEFALLWRHICVPTACFWVCHIPSESISWHTAELLCQRIYGFSSNTGIFFHLLQRMWIICINSLFLVFFTIMSQIKSVDVGGHNTQVMSHLPNICSGAAIPVIFIVSHGIILHEITVHFIFF